MKNQTSIIRIRLLTIVVSLQTMLLQAGEQSVAQQTIQKEEDIPKLIELMTLEEKVGQMVQYNGSWDVTGPLPAAENDQKKYLNIKKGLVGSMLNVLYYEDVMRMQKHAVENTRLGIPLIFGHDVIHGVKTSLPLPLAEAASFNLELIEQSTRIAAIEASAIGLNWTFAPMVDISRDARWGRVMEGAGEDTWWGSQVAKARIKGFQGNDLSRSDTIAACAKHFAGYGYIEAGRDYNHAELSMWRLKNDILPPFEACVEAGAATFMNSFSTLFGVPATGSSYLQREVLKGDWGFKGFVVSDWASIAEMVTHGFAKDLEQAAQIAAKAGSDMDMEGRAYSDHLVRLVNDGKVDEAIVDEAVQRILTVKYDLGLFEDPYRYLSEKREESDLRKESWVEHSRKIATESIVLLKNDSDILPISKKVKKVALIGPLAKDKDAALGNWRSQVEFGTAVSLYEGLKTVLPTHVELLYHEGCVLNKADSRRIFDQVIINRDDMSGIEEAAHVASDADIIIAAVGEVARMSGEARSYSNIQLQGVQKQLLEALFETGKPVVVVLSNGRPLAIPEVAKKATAIVEAWQLGEQSGNAVADVLVGKYNPSGKLPMCFPHNEGQIPIYYNRFNTGRPLPEGQTFGAVTHYEDVPNEPLFTFGHGLSYSTFEYSQPKLSTSKLRRGETLTVSVEITNKSKLDGEEVAQLYIHDLYASAIRPIKELKGIRKLMIPAGATKTVEFQLTEKELGFYGPDLKWTVEAGEMDVFVGGSSATENKITFEIL